MRGLRNGYAVKVFNTLVNQSLKCDPDWKAFYAEQMEGIVPRGSSEDILSLYAEELAAEEAYIAGDYVRASGSLQKLLDSGKIDESDQGWYLQERARYQWVSNRLKSQSLQVAAHKKNRFLLRPPTGVTVAKLKVVSQGRSERMAKWLRKFENYMEMDVTLSDILSRLRFGVKADAFEQALNELSFALGFAGERPVKEWKEGPDNLWALDDNRYLMIECKSEVDITRAEVNKREAEQMNRSAAWFEKHYKGLNTTRLIIHPAKRIESAASFSHEVKGVTEIDLRKFVKACQDFSNPWKVRISLTCRYLI